MEQAFAVTIDENLFPPAKNFTTLGSLLDVVVKNAFVLAGIIAFVLIIMGGFGIITAAGSGDTKKLEQGKQAMTGAIVGLILIVGSFWLIQIIGKLTGMSNLVPIK